MLQGRLDAVQATNVTLQKQLEEMRKADTREARPVRPKAAPAATRPAITRPARKASAASTPSGKTAARRKRGQA